MRNFIFFASYYEAIKELPADQQGQVYKAIVDYAMEGAEPTHLKGIQKSVFILIKPYIDSSKKKQEYGSMGGAPMGNTNAKKQAENNLSLKEKTSQKQAKNNLSLKNKTSNQIIEYEEEKEYIKKEINKEKSTILTDSELYSLIEEEFKDSDVCQKFKDYADMRKAMGKNKAIRTLSTLNSCINKLRKYAKTKQEAIEILDYSIANCYQGLFDKFGHDRKDVAKEAITYAN